MVVERDWDWGPLGGKASQAHIHHTLVQEGYSTLAHPVLQLALAGQHIRTYTQLFTEKGHVHSDSNRANVSDLAAIDKYVIYKCCIST